MSVTPAAAQTDRGVPFMISEIGGIGWATEGGWSYGEGPKTLDDKGLIPHLGVGHFPRLRPA